jgi:hypothetical protein
MGYVYWLDWRFLVPTATFLLLAVLTGRGWALLIPIVAWSLFYVGLLVGWWGNGVGDLWQLSAIINILAGVAAAGLGLWLRRLPRPPGSSRPGVGS